MLTNKLHIRKYMHIDRRQKNYKFHQCVVCLGSIIPQCVVKLIICILKCFLTICIVEHVSLALKNSHISFPAEVF